MVSDQGGLGELIEFHRKLGEYKGLLAGLENTALRAIGPVVVSRGSQQLETLGQIGSLRRDLVRQRGVVKEIVLRLTRKSQYAEAAGRKFDVWDAALEKDHPVQPWALECVADTTDEAIGILEAGAVPSRDNFSTVIPPKAFVAHGGETRALERLSEFLRALGVDPVVVERQASEGRSPDQQVQKHVEDADCGIIFATKGGIRDTKSGTEHPRLNVVDELARLRNRFPNRVILLLESGVDLPSNISDVIYERFTRSNLEKAFLKMAKELGNFSISPWKIGGLSFKKGHRDIVLSRLLTGKEAGHRDKNVLYCIS